MHTHTSTWRADLGGMQKKIIIAFAGPAGAGKDTAANILAERLKHRRRVARLAFAQPLKEAARHLFGFTDEQLYGEEKELAVWKGEKSPRDVLQWLGTDVLRANDPDHFLHLMRARIDKADADIILITDLRFDNEADLVREMGGRVVWIKREGRAQKKIETTQHASEAGISSFDVTIDNDGTKTMLEEHLLVAFKDLFVP